MSWESYEEKHSVKWKKSDDRPASLFEWIVVIYVALFTTMCTVIGLLGGFVLALSIGLWSGLGLILLLLVGSIATSKQQDRVETQPPINNIVRVVNDDRSMVRK